MLVIAALAAAAGRFTDDWIYWKKKGRTLA
jgi:hypothetical protein